MKKALATLAAVALSLVVGLPAQASGINKTRIVNSGNGAYNSIAVHNRSGYAPGAYGPAFIPPGAGYGPAPVGYGGYGPAPVGYGGYGPAPVGYGGVPGYYDQAQPFPLPTVGGMNVNTIINSGNGVGNSIGIRNR